VLGEAPVVCQEISVTVRFVAIVSEIVSVHTVGACVVCGFAGVA
jgi:hypothetical protein